jgi:multiple sugar transport system ATP-binding protein
MASVVFDAVSKVFDDGTRAVDRLDLRVADGEFIVLVGPSGCGKTTALRMLAGLEEASEGSIRIGDRVVNGLTPKSRDIAMVFQSYALYPHLSVYDNIAFPLKIKRTPKEEIRRRVEDAVRILDLEPFLKRKPRALSGGQRQRVAMGRAIVRQPQAFLLDEPLSNLDAKLRVQMRADIKKLQSELAVTTIYVTHDQVEAMTMGHRVAVMRRGELQQLAPPEELYQRPVNMFVGGFIGSPAMNMLVATVERRNGALAVVAGDARIELEDDVLDAHPGLVSYEGREIVLGIRPESLEDASLDETGRGARLRGRAILREALGAEVLVHFTVEARQAVTSEVRELAEDVGDDRALVQLGSASPRATLVGRFSPRTRIREGDRFEAAVDLHALHFFDSESGHAIHDSHHSGPCADRA